MKSNEVRDILNLLINPKKASKTCFLCFEEQDECMNIHQSLKVDDSCYSCIADLMKYLFPSQEILLSFVCEKCADVLLKMYLIIQRYLTKKSILNNIINYLLQEDNYEETAKLKIYINLTNTGIGEKPLLKIRSETIENKKKYETDPSTITRERKKHLNECTLRKKKLLTMVRSPKKSRKDLELAEELSALKKEIFICDTCGKTYQTKYLLKLHLDSHFDKECPYCFKLYKHPKTFKLHLKQHETGENRKRKKINYDCSYCPYTAFDRHSLIGHTNRIHLKLRPYGCPICSKGFYRRSTLQEHVLTHDNGIKYTCEHCGEQLRNKKTFDRHTKLHLGVKLHECNVCSKRFTTSGGRWEHLQSMHGTKDAIKCELCGKGFSLKKYLNRHLKMNHYIESINT